MIIKSSKLKSVCSDYQHNNICKISLITNKKN